VVKVAPHAVDFEIPTRLWEIAENLHRAKLIELGRSAQIVGHAQCECSLVLVPVPDGQRVARRDFFD
jgi:hypothetical protein